MLKSTAVVNMRLDEIRNDCIESSNFHGSSANTNYALRTLRRMLHKAEEWNVITIAGESEAKIVDPSRISEVQAVGCEVDFALA